MNTRYKSMKYKLLMFLNPDATCARDAAKYLYGSSTDHNKAAARTVVCKLRVMGWIISDKIWQVTGEQYELLQKCQEWELNPTKDKDITPDGLRELTTWK